MTRRCKPTSEERIVFTSLIEKISRYFFGQFLSSDDTLG